MATASSKWHGNMLHEPAPTQTSSGIPPVAIAPTVSTHPSAATVLAKPETATTHATANQPHPSPDIPAFTIDKKAKSVAKDNVSVSVFTDRTLYATGGWVEGRVVVRVKNEKKCKLGLIFVELAGYEETLKSTKTAPTSRKVFLHHTLSLQSPYLPPTDLIHPGPPDEHGMWGAKAGSFTLPFRLPIGPITGRPEGEWPESAKNVNVVVGGEMPLPGSFWSAKEGGIRYIIGCTLHAKFANKPHKPIRSYRDIRVIESAPLTLLPHFAPSLPEGTPYIVEAEKAIKGPYLFGIGEKGTVHVRASVRVPDVDDGQWGGQGILGGENDGVWIAGGVGFVGVEILNKSRRKVDTISLSLIRRLKMFSTELSQAQPDGLSTTTAPALVPVTFARIPIASRVFRSGATPTRAGRAISNKKYAGDGWADEEGGALSRRPWLAGDEVHAKKGREWWDGVMPGEEENVVLDLVIPAHARSIRYATLVDVSYVVHVAVHVHGDKAITTELPVTILHPASLYHSLPPLHIQKTHAKSGSQLPIGQNLEVPAATGTRTPSIKDHHDPQHGQILREQATMSISPSQSTAASLPKDAIAPSAEAAFYRKASSVVDDSFERAETLARNSLDELRKSGTLGRKGVSDMEFGDVPRTVLPLAAESDAGDINDDIHQQRPGFNRRYSAALPSFSRSSSLRTNPQPVTSQNNNRNSVGSLTRPHGISNRTSTPQSTVIPSPPSPSPAALTAQAQAHLQSKQAGSLGVGLPSTVKHESGQDISPASTKYSYTGVLDGYYGARASQESKRVDAGGDGGDMVRTIDRMFEGVRAVGV